MKASFSAFADPVTAQTYMTAVVEVKAPSGDREEGGYQIVVTAVGILRKVEEIRVVAEGVGSVAERLPEEEAEGDREVMPVLGVVVHGYWWEISVVYWEEGAAISLRRLIGLYPLLSHCVLVVWANGVVWFKQRVPDPFPAGVSKGI
ncbi:MAG: hypothetical protein M1813_006988 [Trichoglossum hirsutum]|jgi:hypothetical protein|nr:MAG: hypothetical protein M1813_006988 [Trichoglossum hirsutum]